jgi:ketosteroid isomerase-like protein
MHTEAQLAQAAGVLAADGRFFKALLDGDSESLDAVLAPDFVMVDVNAGAVVSRAEFVQLVSSGGVHFDAIESFGGEAIVRFYGQAAVVISRTAMQFTLADGSSFGSGSRYTHVFVSGEAGTWQLASAQGTQIAEADGSDR